MCGTIVPDLLLCTSASMSMSRSQRPPNVKKYVAVPTLRRVQTTTISPRTSPHSTPPVVCLGHSASTSSVCPSHAASPVVDAAAWVGTGKSTCCLSLMAALRANFAVVDVFCGSNCEKQFYGRCKSERLFLHDRLSKLGLRQVLNRQRLALKYHCPMHNALLVVDDTEALSDKLLDGDKIHASSV